jgi:hypothetical protein
MPIIKHSACHSNLLNTRLVIDIIKHSALSTQLVMDIMFIIKHSASHVHP